MDACCERNLSFLISASSLSGFHAYNVNHARQTVWTHTELNQGRIFVKETRSTSRYPVNLNTHVVHQGEGSDKTLVNLSVGGALLTGFSRIPIGTTLSLSFKVPTSEVPIEVQAIVRWSSDESTGVQFDGLRAREVWSINEFFKQLEE